LSHLRSLQCTFVGVCDVFCALSRCFHFLLISSFNGHALRQLPSQLTHTNTERHPMPLLLLSCSSNKAIEAAPQPPKRSRLLLASYQGKAPNHPLNPPKPAQPPPLSVSLSFSVCLCAGNFVLCARQIAPYYVRMRMCVCPCEWVAIRGLCRHLYVCVCVRFDFATSHYPHSCTHALSMALSPNNNAPNTRSPIGIYIYVLHMCTDCESVGDSGVPGG